MEQMQCFLADGHLDAWNVWIERKYINKLRKEPHVTPSDISLVQFNFSFPKIPYR